MGQRRIVHAASQAEGVVELVVLVAVSLACEGLVRGSRVCRWWGRTVRVEEVETPAKPKRVFVVFVKGGPLRFGPECVGVTWHGRCRRRWGRSGKQRVGLEFAQLSLGEAGTSVREW